MGKKLKIALVHDFLSQYGGAERVLEVLHEMYPDAPIYTSFVDYGALGPHAKRIKKWDVRQSPFGSSWVMRRFHSPLRFLTKYVWSGFDFSEYDVVISSSAWYISKGINVMKPTIHVCYLHTPPRHLYGYQTAREWTKHWPVKIYATLVNHFLRMYDFETSQRVDYFIANSHETKRRIEKFYRRQAEVIYPPVSIPKQTSNSNIESETSAMPNDYYLIVSRLAHAKHINIAIAACQSLGKELVIVGTGVDEERLKSAVDTTKSGVTFLGEVSDEKLNDLYKNAKAFLFTAEDEEFGIAPVEAMGYGLPVIAYRSGGVQETVVEGKTGMFFDTLSPESLEETIKTFEKKKFKKDIIVKRAKEFSKERFKKKINNFVKQITL